jgi:ribosomal-protein-alanine N-acetyltransferase
MRTVTTPPIRVVGQEEAEAIALVERGAAASPWSAASVRESLRSHTTRAFVLGEPPFAHLLATCVAEEGEILTVAVLPEHRRRGVASALMEACESWWRERDAMAGWLDVRSDNHQALALYQGRGWQVAHVRKAYYSDGCDALVMRWSPTLS